MANQQVEGRENNREEQAKKTRAIAVCRRRAASLCKLERELLLELDLLFIYSPINRLVNRGFVSFVGLFRVNTLDKAELLQT